MTGTAVSGQCVPATWNTSFLFAMHDGVFGPPGPSGQAGLTFAVLPATSSVGRGGMDLGYGGLPHAGGTFAVEFDTFRDAALADINANHAGVDSDGAAVSSASADATRVTLLNDGAFKVAWIDYDGFSRVLRVFVAELAADSTGYTSADKPVVPLLTTGLDLCARMGSSAYAFVGFTAATGAHLGQSQEHDIIQWSFSVTPPASRVGSSPAPGCPTTPASRSYVRFPASAASGAQLSQSRAASLSACSALCSLSCPSCAGLTFGTGGPFSGLCTLFRTFSTLQSAPLFDTYYANVLTNGAFSQPSGASGVVVRAGNYSALPGWYVFAGSVLLLGAARAPPGYPQAVRVDGPDGSPGGLVQTFPTSRNALYTVSLLAAADSQGCPTSAHPALFVAVSRAGRYVANQSVTLTTPSWLTIQLTVNSSTASFLSMVVVSKEQGAWSSCGALVAAVSAWLSKSP